MDITGNESNTLTELELFVMTAVLESGGDEIREGVFGFPPDATEFAMWWHCIESLLNSGLLEYALDGAQRVEHQIRVTSQGMRLLVERAITWRLRHQLT